MGGAAAGESRVHHGRRISFFIDGQCSAGPLTRERFARRLRRAIEEAR